MGWWLADLSSADIARKVRTRLLPNLRYLPESRLRTCRACRRLSIILAFGADEEFRACLRCRANLRYELLADYLRGTFPRMEDLDVLELDFQSPLRHILERARSYRPTFYRPDTPLGLRRTDGIECQDITQLTLPDASLDLIVSSDVLEHVPDFGAAMRESARVLRPNGVHIFTVPPRPKTFQRAIVDGGKVTHLVTPPEYHRDPLSPNGVLCFWNFGPDLPRVFPIKGLQIRQATTPEGSSGRVIWEARKQTDGM